MTEKKEDFEDATRLKKNKNALGADKSQAKDGKKIFSIDENELDSEKVQEKRREEKRNLYPGEGAANRNGPK